MSGWLYQPFHIAVTSEVPVALAATEASDVATLLGKDTATLVATEGADVATLTSSDTAALIATEGADVAALVGADTVALAATEVGDLVDVALTAEPISEFALDTTESADVAAIELVVEPIPEFVLAVAEESDVAAVALIVEATPDFVLAVTEAPDVAALTAEEEAGAATLMAIEGADASVFDIVRQGNIVLSTSEGADVAAIAFRGPSEEVVGGHSRSGRGEPFVWPKKEVELFLRSSEAPDIASFRVMEWARTDEGRRVLRRRRDELVLMMVD